jgi:hypothetical protein
VPVIALHDAHSRSLPAIALLAACDETTIFYLHRRISNTVLGTSSEASTGISWPGWIRFTFALDGCVGLPRWNDEHVNRKGAPALNRVITTKAYISIQWWCNSCTCHWVRSGEQCMCCRRTGLGYFGLANDTDQPGLQSSAPPGMLSHEAACTRVVTVHVLRGTRCTKGTGLLR